MYFTSSVTIFCVRSRDDVVAILPARTLLVAAVCVWAGKTFLIGVAILDSHTVLAVEVVAETCVLAFADPLA